MKIARFFAIAAIGLTFPVSAQAAVLNFSVTADNGFSVYLSTDDSVRGTLVGSNVGGQAGQWQSSFSYSAPLTASTYYIHVIGTNYTDANGLWSSPGTPNGGGPNPDAFLGQFSVTGGYNFANGSSSITTNALPGQWRGSPASDNSGWNQPTTDVQSFGLNGGSNIWSNYFGQIPGITNSAEWIWSSPDNASYADLSTTITAFGPSADNTSATPLPGALPLFVTGLGALGLLARRRKKPSQP